ncbi:D-alanyl-D-alanine carboxypeptidase [Exiguobacterium sp. SH3S2]|uniref:D-alanyl-D-alanine carboxypeptidase family protein n=1 Tax=unclassified Exiguobacterium TaxID=2644629 RepID=UPI00103F7967|nr:MULTISPECIES: serine hydrolase [unclassified Exiguobacterium]TCI42109.1 D-alanyl-D-alanine carboxypeptidase [Exiguobacterium sp. SH3S3]TCI58353.1 D-alanyl-D-alanine carboxypeptidase [Exiguobacterium sp. SH3S2]
MRRLTVGLMLVGMIAIIPALIGFKQETPVTSDPKAPVAEPVKQGPSFPDIPIQEWVEDSTLTADPEQVLVGAMTFVDLTDGVVLLDKHGEERVYPASTTKLMTALLAYEKAVVSGELDRPVVEVHATTLDIPWDSHIVHLAVGDRLTVRQALYATLLESGNDAANSLAEYVSGSTAEFVELMNERARVLGLTGTNFKNAHGYSDPDHYTTARDMAKITYAFGTYPELIEIAGTYEYEAKFEDKDGLMKRRWWYHLGSAINNRSIHYSDLVKATKTGYTDESGYTMVFLMEHQGKQYALVTMQARSGQTFPTMRLVEQLAFGRQAE